MPKTKILLADDHPLIRQALREIIENHSDFEIIGEAGDGEEAIELCKLMPDIVVMDIGMPKVNGLQATREIKANYPSILVLVLTVHEDDDYILSLLECGADGYLLKTASGEEVVHALRSVVAKETVLSSSVSQKVVRRAARHLVIPQSTTPVGNLTSQELCILRLLALGTGNKSIAAELGLSDRTVKAHLERIYSKLDVTSRTEAVVTALRMGLLNIDDLS